MEDAASGYITIQKDTGTFQIGVDSGENLWVYLDCEPASNSKTLVLDTDDQERIEKWYLKRVLRREKLKPVTNHGADIGGFAKAILFGSSPSALMVAGEPMSRREIEAWIGAGMPSPYKEWIENYRKENPMANAPNYPPEVAKKPVLPAPPKNHGGYGLVGWTCPVCGRGNAPGNKVCPCMDTGTSSRPEIETRGTVPLIEIEV